MSMVVNPFMFGGPLGPPIDDFNRADNASVLGTSSSGHLWVAQSGGWGISSNKAYLHASAGQCVAYCEAGDADVTIEVRLNKSDATNTLNRMGIAFRVSDASNYLYAYFLTATSMRLFRFVAGAGVQIGSATVTGTNGDLLQVVLSGDQITVLQNGVSRIGPVTETHNQTATKHGIFWEIGGQLIGVCRWDDFTITP